MLRFDGAIAMISITPAYREKVFALAIYRCPSNSPYVAGYDDCYLDESKVSAIVPSKECTLGEVLSTMRAFVAGIEIGKSIAEK